MDVFDIIIGDDDLDLIIEKGDFRVDESTLQHQNLLLIAEKGEWKQNPTIGVAIQTYLNDDVDFDDFRTTVQKEFENDGMRISRLRVRSFENIEVEAQYAEL